MASSFKQFLTKAVTKAATVTKVFKTQHPLKDKLIEIRFRIYYLFIYFFTIYITSINASFLSSFGCSAKSNVVNQDTTEYSAVYPVLGILFIIVDSFPNEVLWRLWLSNENNTLIEENDIE
jgi:hypothetical protein